MKQFLPLVFLLLWVSGAAGAFEVPALRFNVNDTAQILDDGREEQLSTALEDIHKKGGPQLVVLTVPTLGHLTIEEAAIQVAKQWKLGTESKDNGILLFIAVEDRKVRIEVGQGVEGDLTDAYSRRIIDQVITPMFRQGEYTDGVLLASAAILARMNPPIELEQYLHIRKPARGGKKELSWMHILIFLIIFIIMSSTRGGRGFMAGMILGSLGGGGRGGGFGGRGGIGGGGGGFSGGGASGSW